MNARVRSVLVAAGFIVVEVWRTGRLELAITERTAEWENGWMELDFTVGLPDATSQWISIIQSREKEEGGQSGNWKLAMLCVVSTTGRRSRIC